MQRLLGMALIVVSLSGAGFAAITISAPEIDGMTAISAISLIAGAVMVVRSRRK